MKLLLIGGIPSSGSTFLIYLLSKISPFLCLPETGLFTQGRLFFRSPQTPADPLHLNVPWIDVRAKAGQALGFNISLEEHGDDYFALMGSLKDKFDVSNQDILVEKTPENIFAFEYYLRADVNRKVVITLRDLESVCFSLLKRKFSMLEAILVWFSHAYQAWSLLKKYPEQIFLIDYEKLCSDTENSVKCIMNFCNLKNISEKLSVFEECDFNKKKQSSHVIQQSSWFLSSRYWSKEINTPPNTKISRWRLGVEFDALVDAIAFKTPENGLIKPRVLETALNNEVVISSISESIEQYRSLNVAYKSLFLETLVKSYPIHMYSANLLTKTVRENV